MPVSPKNSPAVRVDLRPQQNAAATENLREGIFGSKQQQQQPQSKSAPFNQKQQQQQAAPAARPRNPLEYNPTDATNHNMAAQNADDMHRLQQLADAVATTRRQHHLPPLHPHHNQQQRQNAAASPLTQLTNVFNKWRVSLMGGDATRMSSQPASWPGRAAAENPVIHTVELWIDKAQATINNLLSGDAGAGATAGGLAQRRFHLTAARRQQLAFFLVLVLPIAVAYFLVFSTYRPSFTKMGWMLSGKNAMGGEGRIPAGAWDDGFDTCWTSKGAARAIWAQPTKFRIDGGSRWVHCDPLQDPQGMCRVGTYEKIGL